MGEGRRLETLAHERAHVLQLDFVHQAWLRPLEANLARRLPHEGWRRRLDYDVLFPALRWTAGLLGPDVGVDGPIEAEADFLGAPVEPSEESGTLRWTYERNLEPGAGGLDRESVQLVGPRLAGDGTRAVLVLPLVRRAGGDSIRWPVGEPLELPLEGVDEVHRETASERLRWTLRITAAGGPDRLFTASGNGSLPDTLRVEEDAVSDASGPLEALLRVQLEGTTPPAASASAGYETVLQLIVRVVWTIGREPG